MFQFLIYHTIFIKFFEARLFKIFNKEGRLSFWGPRFHNMDSLHTKYNLEEICALQWQRCFELSVDAFSKISNDRVYKLSYESFVLNPEKELLKIVDFCQIKANESDIRGLVNNVSSKNISKGRNSFTENEKDSITQLINQSLLKYKRLFD